LSDHIINISDAKLRSELKKPIPEGRAYRNLYDPARPGFAIRIGAKGIKGKATFYALKRRKGDAQPTWVALGQYPAMSIAEGWVAALGAIKLLDEGKDPKADAAAKRRSAEAAEREKQDNTFGSVVARFNRDYSTLNSKKTKAPRKTAKRTAAAIERLLISEWGKKPIADITERIVEKHIKAIRDRGESGVRRQKAGGHNVARCAFVAARLVFKFARKERLIAVDPTAGLEAGDLYNGVTARDRVLKDEELHRVWNAAERMGYPFGKTVQLLMLTGARREEIAQARWSEIEGDALIVPASRMKMKSPHLIPLTSKAREILDGLPQFQGGDYIFSTTAGAKPSLAGSKRKSEIDALIGPMDHWVLHDLRRSVRTGLSSLRVPREVAERVIAHKPGGIEAVYNMHEYADEKREALEKWEARLLSIVEPGPDDNVVPIRRMV
jgi:integrase